MRIPEGSAGSRVSRNEDLAGVWVHPVPGLPDESVKDVVFAGENDRLLSEWRQVLRREKFGFPARDVETLLDFVEEEGLGVIPPPLGVELPDPDDVPFLEVAHAAEATLITGNTKHYPPERRRDVGVMEPAGFLERWTREAGGRDTEGGGSDG